MLEEVRLRPVAQQGPLGDYGIARSLVQTPGWKPLEAAGPLEQALGAGGGRGGLSFRMGPQQRPYNDMERTILAHNYPGGFKVATDQYAAKYSDQLNEWALAELKHKIPQGPAGGGTWEEEFKRQADARENYYETGDLWGVPEAAKKVLTPQASGLDKLIAAATPTYAVKDDYDTGWVAPKVTKTVWNASPGGGNSRRNVPAVTRNVGFEYAKNSSPTVSTGRYRGMSYGL